MLQKRDKELPNFVTFKKHFGSFTHAPDHLREWVKARGEFPDLVAMLGPGAATGRDNLRPPTAAKEGLVYLIRSGAHYKIGRSDELERRVKEIRIALPEAAELVHSTRTDDPAGIEAYWHRRYADQRANGEWFKLSASDVAAFKRRKYQ